MKASASDTGTLFKFNWASDLSGKIGNSTVFGNQTVKVPVKSLRSGGLQRFYLSIEPANSSSDGTFSIDENSKDYVTQFTSARPIVKLQNLSKFETQATPFRFTIDYKAKNSGNTEKISFQLYDPTVRYSTNNGQSFSSISENTQNNPIKLYVNDYPKGLILQATDDYPAGRFGTGIDFNSASNINVSGDGKVTPVDPKKDIKDGTIIHVTYNEGNVPNQSGVSNVVRDYYFKYVNQDMTAADASIYTGTAVTPDIFKANAGDQKITIWDGNQEMTGKTYSQQGVHKVTLKAHGYNDKTVRLVVSQAPAKPTQATGTVTQPQKPAPAPSQPSTTPVTPVAPTTGENVPVVGQVVYSVGPIYMYKAPDFSTSGRVSYYKQVKRVNRPMFKVIDYAKSASGALRYKVKDINDRGDNAGNVGYITANTDYVVPAYYASVPSSKKVKVISTKGVNSYSFKSLSGKTRHYKKGTTLKVKKVVKHNLTTRYQLTNGKYITANKKLVIQK